ncbi:peptidyl-prolyl cis-trans isomerase [Paenibacillus flagellatus]|uniref:Uncharacterized protein n=1 Tax=Paenibacillus flagellatus TaxID=2211139 RepID=A0A2V5K2J0_9BACL|nr:peptidylprolyl isomerase [Paenibacillus flagellatus]PYI53495.1 hypothetical protein DLM86_17145 [Paenibacillus flagellatus]
MRGTKRRAIALALAAAAAVGILFVVAWGSAYAGKPAGGGGTAAAAVNGEPIELEWMERIMRMERAPVYAYFKDQYGAMPDEETFWTNRYGGERPIDVLRKRALERCVEIKVQQLLLRKNGMLDDIGYDSFKRTYEAEQARRKEAAKRGTVVYGPVGYDEDTYFDVFHNDLFHKLKNRIAAVTEAELEGAYEKTKRTMFVRDYVYELELATIRDVPEEGGTSRPDSGEAVLAAIGRAVADGTSPGLKEAAAVYEAKAGEAAALTVETVRLSKETERDDRWRPHYRALREAAETLEAGEVGGVKRLPEGLAVIRLVSKSGPVIAPFEEAKESEALRQAAVEAKYESIVREEIARAQVVVRPETYGRAAFPNQPD